MNLSDLLKLRRVEKSSAQLAQMPSSFYAEARALITTKDPYESKKAKEVYEDIVYMRQHKILMGCLRQIRGGEMPQNMLGNEKDSYHRIYSELHSLRAGKMEVIEEQGAPAPADPQETLPEAMEAENEASPPETPRAEEPAKPEKKAKPPEKEAGKPKEVFKGETENKALRRVKFLRPMPAFVGPDLQSLGPFDEDEIAEMDEEVAEILLKNDAVELIQDQNENP